MFVRLLSALFVASALLAPASVALSQTTAPGGQTVTVTGLAKASGPVTGANVIVLLHGTSVDANGLRDALTKAGVTGVIPDPSLLGTLPKFVGLRGRMPSATRADIDAATAAVNAYVKAHSETTIVRLAFVGLAADCPEIAAKARTAALADAHDRAENVAAGTGTRVGSVVSVTETEGCRPGGPLAGAYQIDVQTLLMTVPLKETVTYVAAQP
jgi:uncharacterized protein YggE